MSRKISYAAKLLVPVAMIGIVLAIIFVAGSRARGARVVDVPARFDGASDYTAQCAVCHGADGRAQTTKGRKTHAADLTKSKVTDPKGIKVITNGEDSMPAFKDVLNADQIREVMTYVKGFRQ